MGNLSYENGQSNNASGFTAGYADATNNASHSIFSGNQAFNIAGVSGKQNYGYEEGNNAGLTHIIENGNLWTTNKLGAAKVWSVGNGANTANISRTFAWTPGTITSGASLTTGGFGISSDPGDTVAVAISQSLQGCTLSGQADASGSITVTITNNTGSSKTFPALTLYATVTKQQNSPNY